MYEAVLHLANSLRMYATYLQEKNAQMKEHHEKRSRINDVDEWQYLSGKEEIFPGPSARYRTLHLELEKSQPYTPVFLNDHLPSDPRRKYEYLKGIIVPFSCVLYSYTGMKTHLHFIWKTIPSETEQDRMKKNMTLRDELKQGFPSYSTRVMRREFIQIFGRVTNTKSAFLREMYRQLTGDQSASTNLVESEVDARIKEIIEYEDPDLVWDLRVNNKGIEKYDIFLSTVKSTLTLVYRLLWMIVGMMN